MSFVVKYTTIGNIRGLFKRVIEIEKACSLLSPKIIYFDSMKNLIHAMRDMNITDSLKASFFMKISQVVVLSGLGEDQNYSLATDRHTDYGFHDQMKTSAIKGSKDYISMRQS